MAAVTSDDHFAQFCRHRVERLDQIADFVVTRLIYSGCGEVTFGNVVGKTHGARRAFEIENTIQVAATAAISTEVGGIADHGSVRLCSYISLASTTLESSRASLRAMMPSTRPESAGAGRRSVVLMVWVT